MNRLKVKSIKRLLWFLVFGGGPLLLAFSPLPQQQPIGKHSAQPSGLRFDGVYVDNKTDETLYYWLRFYKDGTVVRNSSSKSGTLEESASKVISRLNRTDAPKGLFTVKGTEIEFSTTSIQGTVDFSGTTETNALKLNIYSHINGNKRTAEYQFFPLPEESLREEVSAKAEPEVEQKSFTEVKIDLAGATHVIRVSLGQGSGAGEKCEFTPFEGPAHFPSGTTTIAYQVIIDPPTEYSLGVGVKIETNCASTAVHRCNDYVIMNGRPVNNKWTSVVSCDKGEPFKPGAYKLRVLLDETPVDEISFDIK